MVPRGSIDRNAAQVVPTGRFTVGGVHHTGQQFHQAEVVAPLQWHVLRLGRTDQAAAFGRLRLDTRALGLYGHGLGQFADRQTDLRQCYALGRRQLDLRLHELLEALGVD